MTIRPSKHLWVLKLQFFVSDTLDWILTAIASLKGETINGERVAYSRGEKHWQCSGCGERWYPWREYCKDCISYSDYRLDYN